MADMNDPALTVVDLIGWSVIPRKRNVFVFVLRYGLEDHIYFKRHA
jgi:hypothetical protein